MPTNDSPTDCPNGYIPMSSTNASSPPNNPGSLLNLAYALREAASDLEQATASLVAAQAGMHAEDALAARLAFDAALEKLGAVEAEIRECPIDLHGLLGEETESSQTP